jgi:hypothetical protein
VTIPPTTPGQPQVIVVQAPPAAPAAPAEPATNNWLPGFIGILLMGALLYYGLRYAKNRGYTVQDGLKKMGVEMPQDALETAGPHLKPVPPPQPPLPSLSDLPAASSASVAAAPFRTGTPRLVVLSGPAASPAYDLTGTFTIGRDTENTLAMPADTTSSRRHARIETQNGLWTVVDEGSSNGTFVNGQRINAPQPLQPGDEIRIGKAWLRFEA